MQVAFGEKWFDIFGTFGNQRVREKRCHWASGSSLRNGQLGQNYHLRQRLSTHWGREEMVAISQATFSNAFAWKCVPKGPIYNITALRTVVIPKQNKAPRIHDRILHNCNSFMLQKNPHTQVHTACPGKSNSWPKWQFELFFFFIIFLLSTKRYIQAAIVTVFLIRHQQGMWPPVLHPYFTLVVIL